MKFLYFTNKNESTIQLGVLHGNTIYGLPLSSSNEKNILNSKLELLDPKNFRYQNEIISIFRWLTENLNNYLDALEKINPEEVNYLPPSPYPSKIICLGLNYSDHAEELKQPLPTKPNLFSKGSNALTGHNTPIEIPYGLTDSVDYEAELAIIIGRKGVNIPLDEAKNYILGYTILNDVTARDLEFEDDNQWYRSKSFDTFAPLGPYVTVDDTIDPNNLDIKLWVNNELRQDSNTGKMVFNVYEIVEYISKSTTLYPGDIISTGTPPGIGMRQRPKPKFLKKGDTVKISIDHLGTLVNNVI